MTQSLAGGNDSIAAPAFLNTTKLFFKYKLVLKVIDIFINTYSNNNHFLNYLHIRSYHILIYLINLMSIKQPVEIIPTKSYLAPD